MINTVIFSEFSVTFILFNLNFESLFCSINYRVQLISCVICIWRCEISLSKFTSYVNWSLNNKLGYQEYIVLNVYTVQYQEVKKRIENWKDVQVKLIIIYHMINLNIKEI